MRLLPSVNLLFAASSILSVAHAKPLPSDYSISNRALSDSPSGGYAPATVSCPSTPLIRSASDLSDGEKSFLTKRRAITDAALTEFLNRVSLTDFDVDSFIGSYSPTIGIAFSGGGYRAMLTGGGELAALDSRTVNSTKAGHLGGLLQSATYISGLSGGAWLVGSIVINNFTTIEKLQASETLWELNHSILDPKGAFRFVSTVEYYKQLHDEVSDKKDAGFDVSLTDYWGRALSRQFVDWWAGGPGVTFSSIASTDEFENAKMPFPIFVAAGRFPDTLEIGGNATVFEFNPLELGSFDPKLNAFTNMEYIGTTVTNGVPSTSGVCVRGFDNAGFAMGTSSSIFNVELLRLRQSNSSLLNETLELILNMISEKQNDVANYNPNPFYGVNSDTNPFASTSDLTLVDGGLDGQNIPLHPLIQPIRGLDVIFAMDNSADTSNWPDGSALIATYERSLHNELGSGTLFPAIPDTLTFVNEGLNLSPTFFGCDGTNITSDIESAPPLIVYIPNSPYTYLSNVTTTTLEFTGADRDQMIQNGYNIATRGNGTIDSDWPACVACAIIHRQQERRGVEQSPQCQKCFSRYCWDGTRNSTSLKSSYSPGYQL